MNFRTFPKYHICQTHRVPTYPLLVHLHFHLLLLHLLLLPPFNRSMKNCYISAISTSQSRYYTSLERGRHQLSFDDDNDKDMHKDKENFWEERGRLMYSYYVLCENSPCIIRREKLPAIPEPRLPAFLSPQQVVLRQHPPVPSQQSVWTITVLSLRSYLQVCAALNKSRGSRYERRYLGEKIVVFDVRMNIIGLSPYSASSFGKREMKSRWNWGSITWDEQYFESHTKVKFLAHKIGLFKLAPASCA